MFFEKVTMKTKKCLQKECSRKYRQSEKGKIASRRGAKKFRQTEYGKKYRQEFIQSGKAKECQQRYYRTIKGFLHRLFWGVERRCTNSKAGNYARYGGRGIKLKFTIGEFLDYITNDLGYDTYDKIKGLQIDRIDNNGHYEKGNIRFITAKENCNNRRKKCG